MLLNVSVFLFKFLVLDLGVLNEYFLNRLFVQKNIVNLDLFSLLQLIFELVF